MRNNHKSEGKSLLQFSLFRSKTILLRKLPTKHRGGRKRAKNGRLLIFGDISSSDDYTKLS